MLSAVKNAVLAVRNHIPSMLYAIQDTVHQIYAAVAAARAHVWIDDVA
jgi:hypothetical protein